MRTRRNLKLLAVVPVAISLLLGYGSFPANAEDTITMEKTFEIYNPDESGFERAFPEVQEIDGKEYKLTGIEQTIMESWPEVEEQTITVDQDGYYSEEQARQNIPENEIVQDGTVYYLADSQLVSTVTEARTVSGTTTITYNSLSYIDELPEQGAVTITDSSTGKQYTRELPRTGYRVIGENWMDDFSFPVTIYSVDADFYMLGNLEIPKGADLNQYGTELLTMMGLSPDYYQVSSITLQGEPYEQDGELIQEAIAHGRRRVVDVSATFGGNITIPSEIIWHYQCVYSNVAPDEEINTIYLIQAKATYEFVELVEEMPIEKEKSFWDQLIEFMTNPVTIAVLLILFFFVMCLMLIKRKKKKDKSPVTYIKSSDK